MLTTRQAAPGISRAPDRHGSFLSVSRRGFHRIAYVDWGDVHARRTVVCVHGLTRQGRDFDLLAAELADRGWRVVCPDLVGRGQSDWLQDPIDYALPQYVMDMTALIAHLGATRVHWVGTSLGGMVGIVMAGQKSAPITSLVINDIGPYLPWQALHRIGSGLFSAPSSFADYAAALAFHRRTLAPFGNLSDAEWDHLTRHSVRRGADGRWRALCDPGIVSAFRPVFLYNLSLWTYWDAVTCPTLVLRGAQSDLLQPSTAAQMARRGPRADVVEIPDCGHAPALLDEAQIGLVADWLDGGQGDA